MRVVPMRQVGLVIAASGVLLCVPLDGSALSARPLQLSTRLTAAQESPPQAKRDRSARGSFSASAVPTTSGYDLRWTLAFSALTGPATSAYIHRGKRGTHGAAIVRLCSPCRPGVKGTAYFSPSELALARTGSLYVNIRTARNPSGEIRGQIAVG